MSRPQPEQDVVHNEPKLFVGQLPDGTDEAALRSLMAEHGEVVAISLPRHPGSGDIRKFAMVTFARWAAAEEAMQATAGTCALGGAKPLVVRFADPPKKGAGGQEPGKGISPRKLFVGQVRPHGVLGECWCRSAECGRANAAKRLPQRIDRSCASPADDATTVAWLAFLVQVPVWLRAKVLTVGHTASSVPPVSVRVRGSGSVTDWLSERWRRWLQIARAVPDAKVRQLFEPYGDISHFAVKRTERAGVGCCVSVYAVATIAAPDPRGGLRGSPDGDYRSCWQRPSPRGVPVRRTAAVVAV